VSFKFWSILFTFVLGLLGVGQLHDYLVTGQAPANYEEAPRILRTIIDSHDRTNARRLVEAAALADAAGQYAVIPGNVKRTVERLTGRIERDPGDDSPVNVSVPGLTDSECLRAARFLAFKNDILVLRDEPVAAPKAISSADTRFLASQKARITVSRPLGTNAGFGI
jgi:hypothetical protein